jgi:hypothetical protein
MTNIVQSIFLKVQSTFNFMPLYFHNLILSVFSFVLQPLPAVTFFELAISTQSSMPSFRPALYIEY